jgi:hypothetical protein
VQPPHGPDRLVNEKAIFQQLVTLTGRVWWFCWQCTPSRIAVSVRNAELLKLSILVVGQPEYCFLLM